MEAEIDLGGGQAVAGPAPIERRDPVLQRSLRRDGAAAGFCGRIGGKNRQSAVADQLQHVAAIVVDRGDHRLGVVVQGWNDLLRRRLIGDVGEFAQIAVPQHRPDLLGDAASDTAGEHALPGIPAQIGFDEGAGDACQRDAFHASASFGIRPERAST